MLCICICAIIYIRVFVLRVSVQKKESGNNDYEKGYEFIGFDFRSVLVEELGDLDLRWRRYF
jgi:hypothetical protein